VGGGAAGRDSPSEFGATIGESVAAGRSVAVAVGGTVLGVAVAVGRVVLVAVGGTGVLVAVGGGRVAVAVRVGVGVLVGVGVGVGAPAIASTGHWLIQVNVWMFPLLSTDCKW
jgi:hypothetical protein